MKSKITLLVIALFILNCKNENQNIDLDYKYSQPDGEKIINCEDVNNTLFQEAFYSFENDIVSFYTPDKPGYSRAYNLFISQALNKKIDYKKIVSDHSKAVFAALQKEEDLWITNPDGSRANFKHPIFACIGTNIKDKHLKETYNALLETNSMSDRMIGGLLRQKTSSMKNDKYAATYVALNFFYGKLYDVDFETKEIEASSNTNENQVKKDDSHEGHNH